MTLPALRRLALLGAALFALAGAAAAATTTALSATAPSADRTNTTVLYPRTVPGTAPKSDSGVSGSSTIILVIILGAAGGWMFWQKVRGRSISGGNGTVLAIDETRGLGNRQFLVVASYHERKFLLGVCPGKIDLLARLDEPSSPPPSLS